MRLLALSVTSFLALLAGHRAQADALYSTTDLGTSYQLQTDSNGHVSSVTNADNSISYIFDKAPVDQIHEVIQGGAHAGDYTVYTMSNASGKIGYGFADHGSLTHPIFYPTFEPILGGWSTNYNAPGTTSGVVADMNAKGQVVGRSDIFGAAFSDVNHQSHGGQIPQTDNLNNYIDPIPGVSLTSAVKIDDLGRILAAGSDGHDYLLTPVALGPPQTVPEPTAFMLLGFVGFAVGVRSLHRRLLP